MMEIGTFTEGFCINCGLTFIGYYPQECPECGSDCVDYYDDLDDDRDEDEWF